MSYVVIEVSLPSLSIATLNDKCQSGGDRSDAINQVMNILSALAAGAEGGTIQVTTRDTTSSISTSGSGSAQNSY